VKRAPHDSINFGRRLSYHRAEFYVENRNSINFGMCLKQATDRLPTIGDRTFIRSGGYLMKMARMKPDPSTGGYLAHLTFETPGEHTSLVPTVSATATEFQVTTMPPPNNGEYMDGDAFVYINKDDVLLCTTGISLGTVKYFFQSFFEHSRIRKDSTSFDLLDATNVHKYALMRSRGIKEIEMSASMYEASASYVSRKTQVMGTLGHIGRHISALISKSPHDIPDDSLRVKLLFTVDGRKKTGISIGHRRMEEMAGDIIRNQSDNDKFKIILDGGDIITPDDLVLRKKVSLGKLGKSVVRDDVWVALLEYYQELSRENLLEM
jgi:hypothetical protein